MKKMSKLAVLLFMCVFIAANSACTRIPPGHVGIKVHYSGSARGVEGFPTVTGWVFYIPGFSTVLEYPTFVQTAVWTRNLEEGSPTNEEISFNSKEGLIITGDISLSYALKPDKIPAFYVKFRNDDLEQFTHGFLRNVARDIFNEVASKYSVEDMYGGAKEEFLKEVRARLNESMKDVGVIIEQFGFIGAPRPPSVVVEALNAKVSATQSAMKAENEKRTAEAEAQIKIAQAHGEAEAIIAIAKAQAEANRLLSESLTQLLIDYQAMQKWDGKLPSVTGGSLPMVNIPIR